MEEDQSDQQEQSAGFTRGGSVVSDITLDQARVMAVRTAQANPGRRRWILKRRMLFDVLSDSQDENSYMIVVSFRPREDFDGTPGQERFKFTKTGRFQDREVLRHPKSSKLIQISRKTAVLSVITVGGLIGLAVLFSKLFQTQGCDTRPFC
ncbi:MAG: hypothetical protein BZY81_04890 [SAR202 cluster bacterium Io17-Chloro-G4]|nr:MAG: hypothetical protein BZY81_04890 [SAR202 cluster bacterium Io17-Chloro-G4]